MNIAWRINWNYRTSVFGELEKFHRKNVYERYAAATEDIKKQTFDHLYTERMDWWNKQAKIEERTIAKNPTERNAQTRMEQLNKQPDCTPIVFEAMVNYLKNQFEHILNLGHTEAYSFLCNIFEPIFLPVLTEKFITPTPFETFDYKGDIKHFYSWCLQYEVIDSKTLLDDFKTAFNGKDLRGFDDFVFKFKQFNHCVYLFDQLDELELINYKYVQNNRIIEHLGGFENAHSKRDNYKNNKDGHPKNVQYINDFIDSLK